MRTLILTSQRLDEAFNSNNNLLNVLTDLSKEKIYSEEAGFSTKLPNWEEAADYAGSVAELDAICELFFLNVVIAKNKLNPALFSDSKDLMVKFIKELGFNPNENPFLGFINIFYKLNPGTKISRDNWVVLNDLTYDGVITSADLIGYGDEGTKHIIFNPIAYASEDLEFIIKAYHTLSNPSEVKRLNLGIIVDLAIQKRLPVDYIKLIMFTPFGQYKEGSTMHPIIKDGRFIKSKLPSPSEYVSKGYWTTGDFKGIRNIILFKTENELHHLSHIKTALVAGSQIKSSTEDNDIIKKIKKLTAGYTED